MAKRLIQLWICCWTSLLLVAGTPDYTKTRLTIRVHEVRNSKGVVGILVFDTADGWPDKVTSSIRSKAVPARNGSATLVLDDLPHGDYAVVVLHDENKNMKLDRNLLGMPREGWGMSNNPKARMSAPGFASASFALRSDMRLEIRLNY
jgi:uncharacterized protein (DUF2141 family)